MLDVSRDQLQQGIDLNLTQQWIDAALEALYADAEHRTSDTVVQGLTFEWLTGALIAAQREIAALQLETERLSNLVSFFQNKFSTVELQAMNLDITAINDRYHDLIIAVQYP